MAMKNPVAETLLFKSVSPHIKSISDKTLMIELLLAAEKTNVSWETASINAAFNWENTPQGLYFWSNLHDEWWNSKERA